MSVKKKIRQAAWKLAESKGIPYKTAKAAIVTGLAVKVEKGAEDWQKIVTNTQ